MPVGFIEGELVRGLFRACSQIHSLTITFAAAVMITTSARIIGVIAALAL